MWRGSTRRLVVDPKRGRHCPPLAHMYHQTSSQPFGFQAMPFCVEGVIGARAMSSVAVVVVVPICLGALLRDGARHNASRYDALSLGVVWSCPKRSDVLCCAVMCRDVMCRVMWCALM